MWLFFDFLSWKNYVNVRSKSSKGKFLLTKICFLLHLEGQWWKYQDPDPHQNVMDPQHCFAIQLKRTFNEDLWYWNFFNIMAMAIFDTVPVPVIIECVVLYIVIVVLPPNNTSIIAKILFSGASWILPTVSLSRSTRTRRTGKFGTWTTSTWRICIICSRRYGKVSGLFKV